MNSNYLNATRGNNKENIPVWFMRQAGRYLPEYMEIKHKSNFKEMSHTPNIMAEITLQPLKRYPLDAAIMFSDILTCLEYMGAPFEFTDKGPKLHDHGPNALTGLTALNPSETMSFVRQGIQEIKKTLKDKPLVGFVGAPFTLASYLIEGGTSKDFSKIKNFMFQHPVKFQGAMEHLSNEISNYLIYQVDSGVDAVQIFDSWVGILSTQDYKSKILPHIKNIIKNVKTKTTVPITLYSQPTAHLISEMADSGADVLSVDWRQPMSVLAQQIPENISLQGNLDPMVTTLSWENAKPYVDLVLNDVKKAAIGHRFIFNVGHGVTPMTNPDTIKEIVQHVHNFN